VKLWITGKDSYPGLDILKIPRDSHPHVAVDYLRATLRVKADEVQRSPLPSGCVVRALGTMVEESPKKSRSLLIRRPRGRRTSNSGLRESALDSRNSMVDVLATRDDRGVSIMIWNYHDDDVAAPNALIGLSVEGLPSGAQRVLMRHYRIDLNHSNAYSVWKGMESPPQPTPDQQRQLEAAGQLQLLDPPHWLSSPFGTASINFDLPRQAVSLVRLEW
jgi:hypothetical protein